MSVNWSGFTLLYISGSSLNFFSPIKLFFIVFSGLFIFPTLYCKSLFAYSLILLTYYASSHLSSPNSVPNFSFVIKVPFKLFRSTGSSFERIAGIVNFFLSPLSSLSSLLFPILFVFLTVSILSLLAPIYICSFYSSLDYLMRS